VEHTAGESKTRLFCTSWVMETGTKRNL